ncbi:MAG TPA: lytic murein transglycosylase, partial [Pseudonocardiaceae bacterium]
MPEAGPSTRFRGTALTVLAAGGVFLTAVVITAGSLGLLPKSSSVESVVPPPVSDPTTTDSYGASGILPETTSLSASLLASITAPRAGADAAAGIPEGALQIPPPALAAYKRAEAVLVAREPGCGVSWTLLAGLGRVVSDHADSSLDARGNTTRPILGPELNGSAGLAEIPDTDHGKLDGDKVWDRAVGPMQIIPSVWQRVGADSDGDGTANPHNIFDAALGAGRYLCEGGVNLRQGPEQARAVFRYQRSEVFVRAVIGWT